jgi:hypothetical protein
MYPKRSFGRNSTRSRHPSAGVATARWVERTQSFGVHHSAEPILTLKGQSPLPEVALRSVRFPERIDGEIADRQL